MDFLLSTSGGQAQPDLSAGVSPDGIGLNRQMSPNRQMK